MVFSSVRLLSTARSKGTLTIVAKGKKGQRHSTYSATSRMLQTEPAAAQAALMDFCLQSYSRTYSHSLSINDPRPRNPCNYMDYYLFTGPKGWKAELVQLADP